MSEHFIKNIEIKNFKCFENFKAEGFGRVNLIGGKNNVGKTAFMEACLLSLAEDARSREFIEYSIIIELHRNSLDFLLQWIKKHENFKLKYKNSNFSINKILDVYNNELDGIIQASKKYKPLNEYLDLLYTKNLPPLISNLSFISVGNNFNSYLVNFIDEIKLADKENDLNIALKNFFQIEKIDIIKNKVMLKKDKKYLLLSEFGDGVKHFLNIILALYLNKDSILYLDEIENGIHYTNLDKLWEIILTISKEQNVQVFATTHSKECIESFNRVQLKEKEENKDTYYFEMYRNIKQNNIEMRALDSSQLEYELTHQGRYRGE